MRAHDSILEDLIGRDQVYKVPPFQRGYQWSTDNWLVMWRDLGEQYRNAGNEPKHFFGFVLREGLQPTKNEGFASWQLIDGQQRITTSIILRTAIHDSLREQQESRGIQFQGHHPAFIWKTDAAGNVTKSSLRLLQPTSERTLEFNKIVDDKWRPWYRDLRSYAVLRRTHYLWGYLTFRYLIWLGEESFDLESMPNFPWYRKAEVDANVSVEMLWDLHRTSADPRTPIDLIALDNVLIKQVALLAIDIEKEDENPSVIYEGLNSKGENLQQWDFVRNLIFLQLPDNISTKFFANEWNPVDAAIQAVHYEGMRGAATDAFLYDYLITRKAPTTQGARSIGRNRLYNHLQLLIQDDIGGASTTGFGKKLEDFIRDDLLSHGQTWCDVMSETWTLPELQTLPSSITEAVESIGKFSKGPTAPLVMFYFHAFRNNEINDEQLLENLRLIESFLARLVLCQENLSPLRSRVMSIVAEVKNADPSELRRVLRKNEASPSNDMIETSIQDRDFYGKAASVTGAQLGAIFRGIERQMAGISAPPLPYGADDGSYSVEHVFPQSCIEKINKDWKEEIKLLVQPDAFDSTVEETQKAANKIGNLTMITNTCQKSVGMTRITEIPQGRSLKFPTL